MNKKTLFLILLGALMPVVALADIAAKITAASTIFSDVAVPVVVIGWIVAGYLYISASAAPERMAVAKKAAEAALVGTVLILLAGNSCSFIGGLFGQGANCTSVSGDVQAEAQKEELEQGTLTAADVAKNPHALSAPDSVTTIQEANAWLAEPNVNKEANAYEAAGNPPIMAAPVTHTYSSGTGTYTTVSVDKSAEAAAYEAAGNPIITNGSSSAPK